MGTVDHGDVLAVASAIEEGGKDLKGILSALERIADALEQLYQLTDQRDTEERGP